MTRPAVVSPCAAPSGRVGLNSNYSGGRPASPPGTGPTRAEPSGLAATETSYEQQHYSLSEREQLNDEADKMKADIEAAGGAVELK